MVRELPSARGIQAKKRLAGNKKGRYLTKRSGRITENKELNKITKLKRTWNEPKTKRKTALTVAEIFNEASLSPSGPVPWGGRITEVSAGVYVVAVVAKANAKLDCPLYANYLEEAEQQRWLPNQPVIYIGQTTNQTLSKRVSQFYRHKYGARSPHRGGQAVKLLRCDLWVYWSPPDDPLSSERMMICAFKKKVGQLPFANRRPIRCAS